MTTQADYEGRIARLLCEALGQSWRLIAQPSPPAADLIIGHGRRRIAVELARYRQQGPQNERYDADALFKRALHDVWLPDDDVNRTSLNLVYATKGERANVPRKTEWSKIFAELKALAIDDRVRGADAVRVDLSRKEMKEKYPAAARCFVQVTLRRHPRIKAGLHGTSLNVANVGLDRQELGRLVREKIRRVPDYRAQGPPYLWLVIHNDGSPLSSCIPKPHFPRAIDLVRDELDRAGNPFDAVYWFEEPLRLSGGVLHRVHPGS